nr:hypothetical protein BaRGS_024063 [Batillaria attramentaria]
MYRSHILDWVVVRGQSNRLSVKAVQDCAGLSDHYLIICGLELSRPPPPTRLVTSRNLKGVNLADFQADVRTLIGSMEDLRGPDLGIEGLVHVYNDGLLQILDRHAPSVTRRVRDRPTALWLTADPSLVVILCQQQPRLHTEYHRVPS